MSSNIRPFTVAGLVDAEEAKHLDLLKVDDAVFIAEAEIHTHVAFIYCNRGMYQNSVDLESQ